jgi:hypothetical protein
MPDDAKWAERQTSDSAESEARSDHGLSDRVRRAMAAGLGVASRSKDDLVRAATAEIGSWLDRLDVQGELAKVLAKMVVEVKAEIRFRPREDGTVAPEITSEVQVKPPAQKP